VKLFDRIGSNTSGTVGLRPEYINAIITYTDSSIARADTNTNTHNADNGTNYCSDN